MHPDFIHITTTWGTYTLSSYAAMVWIAIGVVATGTYIILRRNHVSMQAGLSSSAALVFISLVGARLMHIITNFPAYQRYPVEVYSFNLHGLSLFGAIVSIGGIVFYYERFSGIRLWKQADALVPYIGIGIAIARLGCFLNGCCFGVVTRLPWGVRFPLYSEPHLYQIAADQTDLFSPMPVHPTQVYEALGVLIATIITAHVQKRKRFRPGTGIFLFTGLYMLVRLITHYFRAYPASVTDTSIYFPMLYTGALAYCVLSVRNRIGKV